MLRTSLAALLSLSLFSLACGGAVADPPRRPLTPTTDSSTKTYAISRVFLGEAPRAGGALTHTAWRSFGQNLDQKNTGAASTDVCKRTIGAPSSNQIDGDDGIDNAFGSNLLPLLKAGFSLVDPSRGMSEEYQNGNLNLQIQVRGLSDDPTQAANGLAGGVFPSFAFGAQFPGLTPTTDWPVRVEGVADGQSVASGPKSAFDEAQVEGGVFVGTLPELPLVFRLKGIDIAVVIHRATIRFDHTTKGAAKSGTIAGILGTTEVVEAFRKVAGRVSTTLCGNQFLGIEQQIRQASDILLDGTNHAGVTCDGISIGLGFEAVQLANPTKIDDAPIVVPADPCP